MRRHFPTLRETLLHPRIFLFQYAPMIEEKLSEEEHIELNVKLFRGLSEALAFLKPYMEECCVFASKFEVEGSMTRFEMVRVRSPEKFIHDVHMGFFEAVKDGILTEDEVKSYEPLVSSALAKTRNPELVPKELDLAKAPRAVIAVVEESVRSDIDTTLYMGYKNFNDMLRFHKLLETTTIYSDFYGRNVNTYTKVSEIASAYTKPYPTWIKIMPV
jgi:hypothetical protein